MHGLASRLSIVFFTIKSRLHLIQHPTPSPPRGDLPVNQGSKCPQLRWWMRPILLCEVSFNSLVGSGYRDGIDSSNSNTASEDVNPAQLPFIEFM